MEMQYFLSNSQPDRYILLHQLTGVTAVEEWQESLYILVFVMDDDEDSNMLGLFHWMLGEASCTPLGRLTLHVSVYEASHSATPDPSPDIITHEGDSTAAEIGFRNGIQVLCIDIPGETGPARGLGRCIRATSEILWIPPTGRSVSMWLLSSLCSPLKDTL